MNSILKKSLEERKKISQLYKRNEDIVPIILLCEENKNVKLLKSKYLVKKKYNLNIFIQKIHEINNINKDLTIIIKSKNLILKNDAIFQDIYNKYKNEDEFLYLHLYIIQAFG